MIYQRHTLCYLAAHAKPVAANNVDHSLLDYWIRNNFPLIVTRQPPHLSTEQIQLAIPYFDEQTQQKIRSSYLFAKSAISHIKPLPRLQELFPEGEVTWMQRSVIQDLRHKSPDYASLHQGYFDSAYISASKASMSIYGSYCWQYLTQINYVQSSSDLDVLISYQNESLIELDKLYHGLLKKLPVARVDGEVRFPSLGDCSWLELIQPSSADTLLFKSVNQIELVPRDRLYAAFPTLLA
jgi:phosphoribosyl-dephospho-CoA transferase